MFITNIRAKMQLMNVHTTIILFALFNIHLKINEFLIVYSSNRLMSASMILLLCNFQSDASLTC